MRAGHDIGRDQTARLMRELGIEGISRRRKKVFTTNSDPDATRAPDLVNRQFRAERPDALWVTDITYVPTRSGMAYVCFIVDAFSRRIVGWRVASNMRTDMVLDALEMARRSRGSHRLVGLVTHSDAGSQFTSVRFTERLDEIGARPSIGTVADSFDNALAETTNGLYKTECVYGPDTSGWDGVDELELATLSWVHWFNEHRLHGHCDDTPPAEFETAFYAAQQTDPTNRPSPHQTQGGSALHHIEQLRRRGHVDDRGHPRPPLPAPGAHEQRLVETERAHLADAARVLDQGGPVRDHRVHDGVPVTAQLASDRRHRSAVADLAGHPPARPIGEPGPRRGDPGLLLGPGAHLTGLFRATPPALVPHQHRLTPERRQIHQLDRPHVLQPRPSAAPAAADHLGDGLDMHPQRCSVVVVDTDDDDRGQAHEQRAHARSVGLHRGSWNRLA